jgi:hypothetical protein
MRDIYKGRWPQSYFMFRELYKSSLKKSTGNISIKFIVNQDRMDMLT